MFSRTIISLLFLVGCECSCLADTVVVSAMSISCNGNKVEAKGTAVSIYSNERGSILLTCKHVIKNSNAVFIAYNNEWHQCSHVMLHPTEDIAAMECNISLNATHLVDTIQPGTPVIIDGAGPALHKTDENWWFRGKAVGEDEVQGDDGLAVIEGDSGGPVLTKLADGSYAACGIAYAYPRTSPEGLTRRDQHRTFKTVTIYTPCVRFTPWLVAQYGCGPQGCPIQIRPQVIYPVGPLGFQRGPSRVIGIAEPVPQRYVPVPQQQHTEPRPITQPPVQQPQVMQGPTGPAGPRGEQGPVGPRGEPGMSIDQAHVEAVVSAWLDSNVERLRGPQGERGPTGVTGSGSDEQSQLALTDLNARLKELEERPTTVIWADAVTKKPLDTEVYAPGKPIVLKMPRSLRVPK